MTGHLTREQAEGLAALGREEAERLRAEAEAARQARVEAERRAQAERERKAREAEERRKRARKPGDTFRDCPECPEMVVVPEGSFMMGSPEGEADRDDDEGPAHRVTFERPFAVGVYEVTFGEWDACVSDGRCGGYRPGDRGWNRPVVYVSWDDAQAYVEWLSGKTGEAYRLLSEAEWEYMARAGTTTARYWGESELWQCRYANGRDRTAAKWHSGWTAVDCDDGHYGTAPVGSYEANGFGLHDVLGNVQEWVEDCWNDRYHGAPSDGRAWTSGECSRRVLRGGSWWDGGPRYLRSADRYRDTPSGRYGDLGFRVARTLTP